MQIFQKAKKLILTGLVVFSFTFFSVRARQNQLDILPEKPRKIARVFNPKPITSQSGDLKQELSDTKYVVIQSLKIPLTAVVHTLRIPYYAATQSLKIPTYITPTKAPVKVIVLIPTSKPAPVVKTTPTSSPVVMATSVPTNVPVPTSLPAPTNTPVPTNPPAPTSTPISTSGFKDGNFTGDVADAYYGNIQVEITISVGRISDVIFLQYPSDTSHSAQINIYAMPILKSEAIQAQNASVDIVSGATVSSNAFIQSLQSALNKAKT